MSVEAQVIQEQKPNDKEYNFRQIEKKLLEEREARIRESSRREELEKEIMQLRSQNQAREEDDDTSEPYVDHKKLNKTLNKFGQNTQTEIQKAMEVAKQKAKEELKQEMFLESKPDFYDTIQNYANKLYETSPELANSILKMPDSFERQKLVYHNIKSLGLDKPLVKEPTIQDKINQNRKTPYYQPTGVGNTPYAAAGDFSAAGQKNAFDKMQELKRRISF